MGMQFTGSPRTQRRGHLSLTAGVFAVALLSGCLAASASGERDKWVSCGFEGKETNALAIDPENNANIYVATDEGVFKSEDGCKTWKPSDARPETGRPVALAIDPADPSSLFGLRQKLNEMALYKTVDGGRSWNEVKTDLNQGHFQFWSGKSDLAIDPKQPSSMYLIGPRLWASLDRGEHWRELRVVSESPVLSLAIDPANPSTLYLGTDNNDAKKSTDAGQNWSGLVVLVESPYGVRSIVVDPTNASTVYATTWMGVHKSTDGGAHWAEANNGLELEAYGPGAGAIAIDRATPATLYLAIGASVQKSTDGASSWSYAGSGLAENSIVKQLVIDPQDPSILFAATKSGLWRLQH